jgi:hypothetical protein
MKTIKAVPQTYRGVRFRSTLEADWAASLDALSIAWSYEPEAVQLPSGELYRPDFWLPEITTWLEVKGPHDERINKTRELAEVAMHVPDCSGDCGCWGCPYQLVVVGRGAVAGTLTFHGTDRDINILMHACGKASFFDGTGGWTCRACGATGKVYASGELYSSGDGSSCFTADPASMVRAPR